MLCPFPRASAPRSPSCRHGRSYWVPSLVLGRRRWLLSLILGRHRSSFSRPLVSIHVYRGSRIHVHVHSGPIPLGFNPTVRVPNIRNGLHARISSHAAYENVAHMAGPESGLRGGSSLNRYRRLRLPFWGSRDVGHEDRQMESTASTFLDPVEHCRIHSETPRIWSPSRRATLVLRSR